eukprot:5399032-Alexandrium_andersonii.AAC.1
MRVLRPDARLRDLVADGKGGGLSHLAGAGGHARAQFKGEAWSKATGTVDPGSTSRCSIQPPSISKCTGYQ